MNEANSHFLSGKKIIVAGGGIAGTAFAVALHKQWPALNPGLSPPTITIYDRDVDFDASTRKGYSLSLSGHEANSGLIALRSLGLLDRMLSHAIVNSAGNGKMKFWLPDWTEVLAIRFAPYDGLPSPGIRIARRDLRRELVEAAKDTSTTIHWGMACTGAAKLANGRIRVTLSEESTGRVTEEECDLLIAADGANSKIRGCLRPDDELEYAGAVQLGGEARFPGGIPSPVNEHWGMLITGRGVGCFMSPVDKETVVWAVSVPEKQARPRKKEPTEQQFQSMLDEALDLGKDFAQPFRTIVEATDRSSAFEMSARDKKPFPHDGQLQDGRIVFIGDSNHAISPFAGNGANLALMDAWDLAAALCNSDNCSEAVAAYDKKSLPRAWSTLKTSHSRIQHLHATDFSWIFFRMFLWVGSIYFWVRG